MARVILSNYRLRGGGHNCGLSWALFIFLLLTSASDDLLFAPFSCLVSLLLAVSPSSFFFAASSLSSPLSTPLPSSSFFGTISFASACYRFPDGVRDPCLELECRFGADCLRSKDGKKADCVCPVKCYTYGDSVGSRQVCGSDGRDYPNICELRRRACKESKAILAKFQGRCGKPSLTRTIFPPLPHNSVSPPQIALHGGPHLFL